MKISIFDRLTGASVDPFDAFDDELPEAAPADTSAKGASRSPLSSPAPLEDDVSVVEGQLPVDVHQNQDEIIIRAFVAGVRPDELNISIGRDMVEIEGSRMERDQVSGSDFFTQELFWGSFTRVISLPEEIDVDAANAQAKDGLLTITLPKLDKKRQTKLKVKAG